MQTFYEWPPDAPPSIAGVVVLQRGEIRTGASLSEALGVTRPVPAGGTASLRARVAALYDAMSAAMRRGDWLAYGQAFSTTRTPSPIAAMSYFSLSSAVCHLPSLKP